MHGLVNKAIVGMIIHQHGEDTWLKIKEHSQIKEDYFFSDQAYPDQYTYKLVESASAILKLDPEVILIAFGEYWILHTGRESYGALFKAAGTNVGDFLLSLPGFHNRVMLIYPKIKAPEFLVNKINDSHYEIHYYSERKGLQPFVKGLLSGIAAMFEKEATIELISQKQSVEQADVFSFRLT